MHPDDTVLGNVYDKYTTQNPLARFLFDNFLRTYRNLLDDLVVSSILEVGCGEGFLSQQMVKWKTGVPVFGIDLSTGLFDLRAREEDAINFSAQSAYELAFASESFDLVVGAEVLEHLEEPASAILEIARVSRKYVLLSVPREPLWRVFNLARFSYIRDLGNTPGHLQHWSTPSFLDFVAKTFTILRVGKPLPWTVVLAVKKDLPT
jgi:SAM-dependent methyltransferase